MRAINPATEEARDIRETPLKEIHRMVERAKQAQKGWEKKPVDARARILEGLIPLLGKQRTQIAQTITADMGKPIRKSGEEVDGAIERVRFFCQNATAWLAPEKAEEGHVEYDPVGVVGVISPWNYPLDVPLMPILPALLAGNAVVFKPSEYVLQTGRIIGELFQQLDGFPANAFQTVIGGKGHGKELVKQDIAIVSFTGSTTAGKDIMMSSSERLHKVLLELGGLDAAIVVKDADIAQAAKAIVRKNCQNTGQVCCSVKRVFVEKEVYDDFVKAAVNESKKITFGNPSKEVDMGPLIAKFQLEKVEEILKDAKKKGARVLTGGFRPKGTGYYFPSTVVANVSRDMRIMREEPFGPLLPVVRVDSWEEGVQQANDTRYGLTGSVWTSNLELGRKIARKLEVGVAGINEHGYPSAFGEPWGGAKESGIGRMEAKEGMREFATIKLVRVRESP